MKATGKGSTCRPRIDQFRLHGRPGDRQWCHARVRQREADATTGDVQLLDEAGGVAVEIQGLRFEYLGEDTTARGRR